MNIERGIHPDLLRQEGGWIGMNQKERNRLLHLPLDSQARDLYILFSKIGVSKLKVREEAL